MWRKWYAQLLAPRQRDEDIRNREVVLNVLLTGTALILLLAQSVFIFNYFNGLTYVLHRSLALFGVLLFVLGIYVLSRTGRFRLAAWLLVSTYFALAIVVGLTWTISLPSAVLLYGLTLVVAGILLGPRYSLLAFLIVVVLITLTVLAESHGWITPDLTWKAKGSGADEIFGLSFMLGIIAAVSWLFNYQTARSLHRAQRAEAALRRQKASLETTVQRRTRQLQAAQIDKMQQLYRFAELGQISTALLHELANHLTALTIDIEGLEEQNRSQLLKRAKRSIRYLDDMVVRVRDQLRGKSDAATFMVASEISEMVSILNHKAVQVNVRLNWQPNDEVKGLRCHGDPVRFRQVMANLLSNAIDAYDRSKPLGPAHEVLVQLDHDSKNIIITITDWGKGILAEDRSKLFEPFYSTKKTGMGMGLFICKHIIEEQFRGSITLDSSTAKTMFRIKLSKGK